MGLPATDSFETYAAEALRRTFYMDCAVRYETSSGESLHGIDLYDLFGYRAGEIFDMSMEERFLLYASAKTRVPYPQWHMASYLDPVPKSVEALPFLLRSLSSIQAPVGRSATEREVIASSVKMFLGKAPAPIDSRAKDQNHKIVVPSLCEASTHYWFSNGYPVDAVKASAEAFENRHRYDIAKGRRASVEIVCNEDGMKGEVREIVNELARSRCDVDVLWNASAREFIDVFAEGYNVVQFIGHCSANGFQCSDGFTRTSDVVEDHTPMFFFNNMFQPFRGYTPDRERLGLWHRHALQGAGGGCHGRMQKFLPDVRGRLFRARIAKRCESLLGAREGIYAARRWLVLLL